MPSIISSRAPGIAAATERPAAGRTSGSRVPWMTTVGAAIPRNRFVRSPFAVIACSCRAAPAGLRARS